MRSWLAAAVLTVAAAGLSACASSGEAGAPEPAWVGERAANAQPGYPDLHDVPRTHQANTNQAFWDGVRTDVVAAGQAMKANPRAAFGQIEDPNAFLDDAREDLEETRDSH